jgi:hypothetical protein
MIHTTPICAKEFFTRDLTKKFSKSLELLYQEKSSISYGKSILNLSSLDTLRLIYESQDLIKSEKIFKKFIIKNFSDAERRCPGSGPIAVLSFIKALETSANLDDSIKFLKSLSTSSRRGDLKDLESFLEEIIKDIDLLNVSKKILSLGGFSASCSVETTYSLEDSVDLDDTCIFKIRADFDFISALNIKTFKKSNSYIIVADGVIEDVSEIHHILEYFSKTKEHCFLVCRGYSKDVINTLATNYKRGSLRVIPGLLITDLESINSLKDICVISNSSLISNLKGDKFSTFDLGDMSKVEYISLNENQLEIRNPSQYSTVVSLAENLRKQILEEPVQDKIDLLEKRIASLSPRKLRISFSNHQKDSVGLKKDRLKLVIAMINDFCSFGKIDFKSKYSDSLIDTIISSLKDSGVSQFPAKTFFEGVNTGIFNAKMIKETGKIILVDS